MKFGQDTEIDFTLLDKSPKGDVLEITFRGIHDHMWPYGNEIVEYIQSEIDKCEPIGVLINFLSYEYTFGNEIGGPIFAAIFNTKDKTIRPFALVADGITAESLESLISEGNIRRVLDIKIFQDREMAIQHVDRLLSQTSKS